MTRAAYFIGGPGTGKSTAVRALLDGVRLLPAAPADETTPLLVGQRFRDGSGLYLGKRGGRFPGTDRMSMAVHPEAVRWAAERPLPVVLVGEGARLGTFTFLNALASRADLLVVHLTADRDTLERRYRSRGSRQNETWARGRFKAAANAAARLAASGANVLTIDTSALPETAAAEPARSHLGLPDPAGTLDPQLANGADRGHTEA